MQSRFGKDRAVGFFGFGKSDGPERYTAAGKLVTCSHCGGERFKKREAQLNTALMSAMDLDCFNESAVALICEDCGHLEWFINEGCLRFADQ